MNVMDRSFSAQREASKSARSAARKRRYFILAAPFIVVAALVAYYVWAATLCGNCGAPPVLPPA